MLTNIVTTGLVKFSSFSDAALASLPNNSLVQNGLEMASRIPFGQASGFDQDVKDEINPMILGFVYLMYAMALVFVILGILKARSEDKGAAMWSLMLAAIIGVAGIVVKRIFTKVAGETQIDF